MSAQVTAIAPPASSLSVDIGDARIATQSIGAGPPIVCVSGLDGRAAFWRAQAGPLSGGHRVITFDQRGCGRSSHSKIRYSVRQMAEDLVSVLDELKIERASLVCHGPGGAIALQLALVHPGRVDRLVLGAPAVIRSSLDSEQLRLAKSVLGCCGAADYASHWILRSAPASWLQPRPWEVRERVAELLDGLADVQVETSRLQALLECDLRVRLLNVRHPTLVIAARDDQVVPHTAAQLVAGAMPNAQLQLLPSGGHLFPQIAADDYNAAVRCFLDSPPRRAVRSMS